MNYFASDSKRENATRVKLIIPNCLDVPSEFWKRDSDHGSSSWSCVSIIIDILKARRFFCERERGAGGMKKNRISEAELIVRQKRV